MRKPVIVDAVRTPVGRRGGALSGLHPATLLGRVFSALLERSGLPATDVNQVFGGCVTQVGEQAFNVTRVAWLAAGLPPAVPALTIDVQCGSSHHANHLMHAMIAAGACDIGIVCGVESMSRVEIGANASRGPGVPIPPDFGVDLPHQFVAAERIAAKHGFTRDQADEVGRRSQERAASARASGAFDAEIVPIEVDGRLVRADECIRDTTTEGLARLEPIREGGIHTAGNTSQISDGAAAVLWMDASLARSRGLRARARLRAQALIGADPYFHIEGPVEATAKVLRDAGLTAGDVDRFEVNEAFASVVLAWERAHAVDGTKLNAHGGAIALGHPMGAAGARLTATAVHALERDDLQLALVTMCCGGALATASVIERA